MSLELIPLTEQLLSTTLAEWESQAEQDDSLDCAPLIRYLEWVSSSIVKPEYKNTNYYFYGLVKQGQEPDSNYARSIVEASQALPNTPKSWLKVLKTRYEPKTISSFSDKDQNRGISVVSQSFFESTKLIKSDNHKCKKVKMLAENEGLANLYKGMATHLNNLSADGISVKYYRNWLEFDIQ